MSEFLRGWGQLRRVLPVILAMCMMQTPNFLEAQLRVEPPGWWTGMRDSTLQLMVYGEGVGNCEVSLDYPGVRLVQTHRANSPSYLFLDLEIGAHALPGALDLTFEYPGQSPRSVAFPLSARKRPASHFTGFGPADAVYLITPDRFANGDPSNDSIPGMRETRVDRTDDYARHGGDIQGIIDHLDYLADMGFTALWPSPLLTNDMPRQSYHGYAITDYYQVDPRFGDLETYLELAEMARQRGIKLIMDQVVNHCGLYHWWMSDLPFPDWVNMQEAFEAGKPVPNTNHRRTVNQDPYASDVDKKLMDEGWFVPSMPDLNQSNPFLARYLIQNSIWWIETLGLGGIRQDTYPYADKAFTASWAGAIMREYPEFSIVGEEWSYNPLIVGYWQDGAGNRDGYRSHLRAAMDFPLQRTLMEALMEEEDWDSGLIRIYEALANDFYYRRPEHLLFFGDNHDMDRLYTQLGESPERAEMALAFILTAPRTPQIYYGTEILMQNTAKPGDHGLIRTEFPGGWEGGSKNAFTGAGLSTPERHMQQTLRKLLQFRKESRALTAGETRHFAPEQGVYLLARIAGDETVVLLLNRNDKPVELDVRRFAELGLEGRTFTDLIGGGLLHWGESVSLTRRGAYVLTPVR